jgi:outer membrane biosynthesis protein TonB
MKLTITLTDKDLSAENQFQEEAVKLLKAQERYLRFVSGTTITRNRSKAEEAPETPAEPVEQKETPVEEVKPEPKKEPKPEKVEKKKPAPKKKEEPEVDNSDAEVKKSDVSKVAKRLREVLGGDMGPIKAIFKEHGGVSKFSELDKSSYPRVMVALTLKLTEIENADEDGLE